MTTLFLFSSPIVLSEEIGFLDLVEREGIWYKKFSEEPFTGNVVGEWRGGVAKGKREGKWTRWWENDQLRMRTNYKNGKEEGLEEWYDENGQLKYRYYFKNGELDGLREGYCENGQLRARGHYKNGESVGKWEWFNEDGKPTMLRDCDVEDCS